MTRRILQAFILLNILTLSTLVTAGAEGAYNRQIVFPDLPVSVRFPAKEQVENLKVSDLEFTPDNQALLLLTPDSLYQLDLRTETIDFIAKIPISGPEFGEPQMEWLNDSRHLIFNSSSQSGTVLKWPSLEKEKENLYNWSYAFDRRSVLYQKIENNPHYLWNLASNEEEPIPPIAALQYVDFDPTEKTMAVIQGASRDTDYGYEIGPLQLVTWNYAGNTVIRSVTLEGAYCRGGTSFNSTWSQNVYILDRIKRESETYLLGVVRGYNYGDSRLYNYAPMVWDQETGRLENSLLLPMEGPAHYMFFPPPYGVSLDGRWLVETINAREMKILPVEQRLRGITDRDIGPVPKGNFSFSHDSKRMALSYPLDGNFSNEWGLAIVDLEADALVKDFTLH